MRPTKFYSFSTPAVKNVGIARPTVPVTRIVMTIAPHLHWVLRHPTR